MIVWRASFWVQVLSLKHLAMPNLAELKPNEVVVRVCATGVCYRDVLDRQGAFPFIQCPAVLGHEIGAS